MDFPFDAMEKILELVEEARAPVEYEKYVESVEGRRGCVWFGYSGCERANSAKDWTGLA
jgi:hypothetical protein